MRIISGKYKGRTIQAPKSIPARPTTDRSKESLFNILENKLDLEGIKVLDLFSGTGNMAYEFASRGASVVHAVDQHYAAVQFINQTFRSLGFEGGKAIKANAITFVNKGDSYDLIFADPPYHLVGIQDFLSAVLKSTALVDGGIFILEHAIQVKPGEDFRVDYRVYGQSAFSIYQKNTSFETNSIQ